MGLVNCQPQSKNIDNEDNPQLSSYYMRKLNDCKVMGNLYFLIYSLTQFARMIHFKDIASIN
jgi:hypothetical protein